MRLEYHVTFEYEQDAPRSIKGYITGTEVQTCARRAVEEAKEKMPGSQWTSIVIILSRPGIVTAV